jgi:hypothetical protein
MRSDKVIICNCKGEFCLQPLKRFGEAKSFSAQVSIRRAPGEVGAFHERCVNGITIGVLQSRDETILLSQDQ